MRQVIGAPALVSAAGDRVTVFAEDLSAGASSASSLVATMLPFAPKSIPAGATVSLRRSAVSARPAGMGFASGAPVGETGSADGAGFAGSCAGFGGSVASVGDRADPPPAASPVWETGSSAAGGTAAGSEDSVVTPEPGGSVPGPAGTPAGSVGVAASASGVVCPAWAG
ncbi:MAG: hypothetical protein ABW135_00910 [Thermoleophilaceae bacterium]